MNRKAIISCMIMLCCACFVLINKSNKDDNKYKKSLHEVKVQWDKDIDEANKGKYSNLKFHEINYNMNNIESLYRLRIIYNTEWRDKKYDDIINELLKIVDVFFGGSIESKDILVHPNYEEYSDENIYEYSVDEFREAVNNHEYEGDGYLFLFCNKWERGGKGMIQVCSDYSNIWMAKGKINGIMPYYDAIDSYNLVTGEGNVNDTFKLLDKEVTIKEMVEFVTDYLDNHIPVQYNREFKYRVVEARTMDAEGIPAIGMNIRREYEGVPFDYINPSTINEFNSDYDNERGWIVVADSQEIENLSGLGGMRDTVEKIEGEYDEIIPLSSALEELSNYIGDNSIYDVYGIEVVYQFQIKESDKNSEEKISEGIPKWKIITVNENDDKYTWFYVDMKTGEISHRYKER